jgi:hypothetical protein
MTTLQSVIIPQVATPGKSRITEMQTLHAQGYSYAKIGRQFNVSKARVHQIITGYGNLISSIGENGWYAQLRDTIFDRDQNQCQQCKTTEGIIIHHLDGDDRNNDPLNLITLCSSCHGTVHAQPRHEECQIKFICEICGKQFTVRRSQVKRTQKKIDAGLKVNLPRYCSKTCYGVWLGSHYGTGRPKQSPI